MALSFLSLVPATEAFSAGAGSSGGSQSSKASAACHDNSTSSFFFGIKMRSRTSGPGEPPRARHIPSEQELASAPYTCPSCEKDENGRMKVLSQAKSDFLRESGYSYGRAGYVIDYVVPLQCGGEDAPANMRWLSLAEAGAREIRCP